MTNAVAPDVKALMSERIDVAHQRLAARWLSQLKQLYHAQRTVLPKNLMHGRALRVPELPELRSLRGDDGVCRNSCTD